MSATITAPPNTATIVLPPGYTLEQFQTLQGQLGDAAFSNGVGCLVTIAITVAVAFGVVVWD
ncbi:hypothetical protein C0993_010146 [Termitomyces sp. T159_Od127]|nr:hypothetical protein C0993_010146 [Termitomyces sp. T159_Od127]